MKYLIPIQDYQRIHNTIYSVLSSEEANLGQSCVTFAIHGACILRKHYKIDAKIAMGPAAILLNKEGMVLSFMNSNEAMQFGANEYVDGTGGEEECFHAWVEANGWLIDFAAPTYSLITPCGRKMLQQKIREEMSAEVGHLNAVEKPGLTPSILNDCFSSPGYVDLIDLSVAWYRRPPEKMKGGVSTVDTKGRVREVPFIHNTIEGVW